MPPALRSSPCPGVLRDTLDHRERVFPTRSITGSNASTSNVTAVTRSAARSDLDRVVHARHSALVDVPHREEANARVCWLTVHQDRCRARQRGRTARDRAWVTNSPLRSCVQRSITEENRQRHSVKLPEGVVSGVLISAWRQTRSSRLCSRLRKYTSHARRTIRSRLSGHRRGSAAASPAPSIASASRRIAHRQC